jgi:hypothetical protein
MHTAVWSENLKGKKPIERPRRRWENDIRNYLREIGWEGVDWMNMDRHKDQCLALVNTVLSIRVS